MPIERNNDITVWTKKYFRRQLEILDNDIRSLQVSGVDSGITNRIAAAESLIMDMATSISELAEQIGTTPGIVTVSTATVTINTENETIVAGSGFSPPITTKPRIINTWVGTELIDQAIRAELNGNYYDVVLAGTPNEIIVTINVL